MGQLPSDDDLLWSAACPLNASCPLINSSAAENVTEAPAAPTLTTGALVRVVVLLVIATLSLVGNCATLASIWHMSRAARSSLYLLLAHLSVADLLVTAWCILAEAAWTATVKWLGGNVLCKLFKYMQIFSLYLSTFILVVIGYDQLLALRYPMERARNRKCTKRFILAVWILSALLSLPQVSRWVVFFSRAPNYFSVRGSPRIPGTRGVEKVFQVKVRAGVTRFAALEKHRETQYAGSSNAVTPTSVCEIFATLVDSLLTSFYLLFPSSLESTYDK